MTFDARQVAAEATEKGEDVLATTVGQALGYASACWDNLEGAGVFRSTECRQALDSLLDWLRPQVRPDADKPRLGLATTRELLEELRARIEVDYFAGGGGLDYTTVAGRPGGNLQAGGHHVISDADCCPPGPHSHDEPVVPVPVPEGAVCPPWLHSHPDGTVGGSADVREPKVGLL